jgi:hypothetical protein
MRKADDRKRSFSVFVIFMILTWAGAALSQVEKTPPPFKVMQWNGAPHSLPSGTAVIPGAETEGSPAHVMVPQPEVQGDKKQIVEQTPKAVDAVLPVSPAQTQKNPNGIQFEPKSSKPNSNLRDKAIPSQP